MKGGRIQPILLGFGLGTALGVAGAFQRRLVLRHDVTPGLDGLTRDELYQLAREAEIPGRSSMSKDELIRALRAAHHR
jgi:hypothetical protein